MTRSTQRVYDYQPPALGWREVGANLQKYFYARKCIQGPELYRKVMFVNNGGGEWGRNWMTYSDMYRQVMYANPPLFKDVGGGLKGQFRKKICKELNERSRSVHKTHVHQPHLSWGRGKVQFTEIFYARNCIKCPELYRIVMFVNTVQQGWGMG